MFVLFLDINHVDVDGSHRIRQPLVDALDRLIGPDDLVAVMTPDMSARDITFARKTTTIEGLLTQLLDLGRARAAELEGSEEEQYKVVLSRAASDLSDGRDDDRGDRRRDDRAPEGEA